MKNLKITKPSIKLLFSIFFIFLISFVNANSVFIDSLDISSENDFTFENSNSIIVKVNGFNNSFIDIEKIYINLSNNLTYTTESIYRFDTGHYRQSFLINNTNISEFNVKVGVYHLGTWVEKDKVFKINKESIGDKLKKIVKQNGEDFTNYYDTNFTEIIIYGWAFLFFIAIFVLVNAVMKN